MQNLKNAKKATPQKNITLGIIATFVILASVVIGYLIFNQRLDRTSHFGMEELHMRSEKNIKELREELAKLTDFISDYGTDEESEDEDVEFALDVLDAIDWVLGDISTKDFRIEPYLNIERLKEIVDLIEERTGETFET